MKVKHLKGNIYAIKGKPVKTSFNTPGITANSLFIDDRKKAVIDPAADKVVLQELGKKHRVDYCFLTHAHLDHTCSLSCFPDAKVYIHRDENATLDGVSYNMLYSRHISFFLSELWKSRLFNFKAHHRFDDLDTFEIGGTLLQVLHAPGHTGGHSFFYFPNERILYSGDFDLSVMGPSYSYVDSSIDDMLATARRAMELPVDIWVSGHWRFVITDDLQKRIERFAGQINQRDEKMMARLDIPQYSGSLAGKDIVLPATITKDSWLMKAMEKRMIAVHLSRLRKQGKVRRTVTGRWVRRA